MPKIYINGKFFSQRVTGTQRYARELLKAVDRLLSLQEFQTFDIEILAPRSADSVPGYTNLKVRTVGKLNGTKWEQIELPRYCKGELLFTLSGGAPVLHARNVVTLHDAAVVAVPSGYSLPYRLWHAAVCRRMAHHAEHIFTNSNFSKSEIVKWYGAPVDRTSVTYLGSDHFSTLPSDPAVLNRFGISGRYVLAVSSHNPNKNFQRVQDALTALAETGVQLVIAGAPDSRIYRNGLKPSDKVHAVGYVGDPELKALYEHAACFVFASLYEGFGLPPLEALASGCPIVVSRAGSLPELFDGIGTFCDPYSATDIAAAIQRTIQSPSSRDDLKDFANKFTWENCARQTLEVLNRLS